MTCPKCGLETLADQKFCRSCGARLQLTTQQLLQLEPIPHPGRISRIGAKRGDERANHFVFWGFIVMLIGAAIGVVGKKLLYEDVVTVIGVLVSLAGMFLIVYPYLSPFRRKEDESSLSSQQDVLTPSQSTEYLPEESSPELVTSVTERTTELLENSARKRRDTETKRIEDT